MAAKFATTTSVTIPKTKTAADPINFEVAKGGEGKLVVNFTIENTGVKLMTAKLEATFAVTPPTALCPVNEANSTWAQLAGFTIGDKTVTIAKKDPAFQDMTAVTVANLKNGDAIKVGAMNNDPGSQNVHCHVWVDWDNNGLLSEAELVATTGEPKSVEGTVEDFLTATFNAPAATASGKYFMRVATNYKTNKTGCAIAADDESLSVYDLAIKYTAAAR